jgi:hypothetical protein
LRPIFSHLLTATALQTPRSAISAGRSDFARGSPSLHRTKIGFVPQNRCPRAASPKKENPEKSRNLFTLIRVHHREFATGCSSRPQKFVCSDGLIQMG